MNYQFFSLFFWETGLIDQKDPETNPIGRPVHESFNTPEKIKQIQKQLQNLSNIYNKEDAIEMFGKNLHNKKCKIFF